MKKILLLFVMLLGLQSNTLLNAAEYWIQVAVYDHNIGDDYFKDAGVSDVAMHIDAMDIYRYYIKGYSDENTAEVKKNEVAEKGFKHAKVVDIEALREICKKVCTSKNPSIEAIYFDFDKSKIKERSERILKEVSTIMVENPDLDVQLNGHTDSKGSTTYNDMLSSSRARQAKNYLIQKGISPNRIATKGYGEVNPVALNQDDRGRDLPEGRKFNRRVEIILSTKEDGTKNLFLTSKLLDVPLKLRIR